MQAEKTMLYRLHTDEGARRLSLHEETMPRIGPGQVLVRMRAASLNYRDLLVLDGAANAVDGLIPLSDGAGVVMEAGEGVHGIAPGDGVVTRFFADWLDGPYERHYARSALGGNAQHGVLSEVACLPASAVLPLPARLTFAQAASLPCAAVTAWQAMFIRTRVARGDTVLIQGTGGVAVFALQFARAVGARTIVISSSDDKLQRAALLGADELINYRQHPEWDRRVLALTGGRGATFILENGGPASFDRSLNALAPGGRIAQIGVLTGFGPTSNLMPLQNLNADILGITVGSGTHMLSMLSFMEQHAIVPVIDAEFQFAEAEAAYAALRAARHFGKIIIRF